MNTQKDILIPIPIIKDIINYCRGNERLVFRATAKIFFMLVNSLGLHIPVFRLEIDLPQQIENIFAVKDDIIYFYDKNKNIYFLNIKTQEINHYEDIKCDFTSIIMDKRHMRLFYGNGIDLWVYSLVDKKESKVITEYFVDTSDGIEYMDETMTLDEDDQYNVIEDANVPYLGIPIIDISYVEHRDVTNTLHDYRFKIIFDEEDENSNYSYQYNRYLKLVFDEENETIMAFHPGGLELSMINKMDIIDEVNNNIHRVMTPIGDTIFDTRTKNLYYLQRSSSVIKVYSVQKRDLFFEKDIQLIYGEEYFGVSFDIDEKADCFYVATKRCILKIDMTKNVLIKRWDVPFKQWQSIYASIRIDNMTQSIYFFRDYNIYRIIDTQRIIQFEIPEN